jgi:Na+/melibiose symporter-like transporter
LGLISLVFDLSTTAVIPELAGSDLTRANALHQGVTQLAGMAGPALAGLVIAALGGFTTLWFDVLSFSGTFFVVLYLLPGLKITSAGHKDPGVLRGIQQGFQWLWHNPVIRALCLQAMVGNFGFGMVSAVLMFYLRSTLGLNAEISGLNYAMLGIGGVLGSVLIVPLNRRFRKGLLYPGILAFGLCGLLIMALVRTWWAPGLGFGMVSACNIAWVVLSTSVRQTLIPSELMGRVLSFSRIVSLAAMPLGAMAGGYLISRVDPAWVFYAAAITKLVEMLIAQFSEMKRL